MKYHLLSTTHPKFQNIVVEYNSENGLYKATKQVQLNNWMEESFYTPTWSNFDIDFCGYKVLELTKLHEVFYDIQRN